MDFAIGSVHGIVCQQDSGIFVSSEPYLWILGIRTQEHSILFRKRLSCIIVVNAYCLFQINTFRIGSLGALNCPEGPSIVELVEERIEICGTTSLKECALVSLAGLIHISQSFCNPQSLCIIIRVLRSNQLWIPVSIHVEDNWWVTRCSNLTTTNDLLRARIA